MGWKVFGDRWESGELSNTHKYCKFNPNKSIVLKAVRTWLIVYNNPTFTNLNMKIYSRRSYIFGGYPQGLIATSTNILTKAEICTLANGVKEVYFEFAEISLNGADNYYFVINGAGYSYSDSSYLSWRKAFPDPVYDIGVTLEKRMLGRCPYALYVIGDSFDELC